MTINGLNVRIIDGPVDLDVTEHVTELTDMTKSALGGFGESVQITLDLPRWTFPTLGEQSRVIVTDDAGEVVWEGFASDPGPVAGEGGEAFEVLALGSMVLASDRVEPLVYADAEPGSWVAVEGASASAQLDSTDGGFRLAHPQGQPITDGAFAGAEWRLLEHSSQDVAQVGFTMKCGLTSSNYGVQVFSVDAAGVASVVAFWGASTAPANRLVTLPAGTRVVQVRWTRSSGGATNVTDDLAWVQIGSPVVLGALADKHGFLAAPKFPLTSTDVVADLIGRGMLAGVDPAAAALEPTVTSHFQLSFADGARGSKILAELRKTDPDMLWAYGAKGAGGYAFSWRKWPTGGHRYTFSDLDEIALTGGDDERCHRIGVYYTDPESKRVKHIAVTVDLPRETRTRDADPITLEVEATTSATAQAEAVARGREALIGLAGKPPSGTVTVTRQVVDHATNEKVEPWEIEPGSLALIESTGEILRIMSTSVDADGTGASCTVNVGDPEQTLEDRLLGLLRGEIDPNKPLIGAPKGPVVPTTPNLGAPTHALKEEMDATVSAIADDFVDVYATIANGDSANATAINDAVSDFVAGLATKSKHTLSPNAPGVAANNVGDVWEQHKAGDATKIIARYRGQGGTSWLPMNLDATYIPMLDIGNGTFGTLDGGRLTAKTVGIEKLIVADFTDYVRDPAFDGLGTWSIPAGSGIEIETAGAANPNGRVLRMRGDGGVLTAQEPMFPAVPGDKFHVSTYARRATGLGTTGTVRARFYYFDVTGAALAPYYDEASFAPSAFTGAWQEYSFEGTIPAGAAFARMQLLLVGIPTGNFYDFREVHVRRKNAGNLIVDNEIQARHLKADSITGLLVTGAAIQTHDDGPGPWTTGRGLKLSNSGLVGYPAAGVASPTFAFDTSTGRAHLTGGLSTGTGYDDITITPGTASTPSAMEFWTNGPYYDNSNGNRAGLSCFDAVSGSDSLVYVRLHGPKMTTKTVRPRIDMVTRRTSAGGVIADVSYHAGGDPQGEGLGTHWLYIDGNWKFAVGDAGATMPAGTRFAIGGVLASSAPANGIRAVGDIKSGGRIDADAGFFDQSVAIGSNGSWKGASTVWNSAGRLAVAGSTRRVKQDIETMGLDVARRALDLESVTFRYKPEAEMGTDLYPGVIAEQAVEAGLDLWVTTYDDGSPAGFRYAELAVAHNVILRDQDTRLADALARIETLEALLAAA